MLQNIAYDFDIINYKLFDKLLRNYPQVYRCFKAYRFNPHFELRNKSHAISSSQRS